MWKLKRCFLAVIVCMISLFHSPDANAGRKIGILMFSEESRYQEAARGMIDKLTEEGMGAPKTTFLVKNAGGNKARAAELVKEFSAAKLDLIFTLGTSATAATANEIHDVPIVFASVYDPVEAGMAKSWRTSGTNITGTSTKVPMRLLLDRLEEIKKVDRMAVLYTPGEKNSELAYRDMRNALSVYEIKIVPVPLTKKEDITQVVPAVIRTSDAIYVTGSNLIDSQVSIITEMAARAQVITITHLEDLVKNGVLFGVCVDSYRSGRLAGDKAVRILKGASPSDIPIETLKEHKLMVNRKTLQAGQFHIPQELLKLAR